MPIDDCWGRLLEKASGISVASLPQLDLSLFPCSTGEQGSVTKLTEDNLSAAHLFRSAIRSMALNYRWAAGRLPSEVCHRILGSGGLVQKTPLLQADIAELVGLPLEVSSVVEDALTGLMKYAITAVR